MAPFFSSTNCIKRGMYTYTEGPEKETVYRLPGTPVLKRYLFKLSYEDKYRFGVLTYPEYCEWMLELQKEAEEKANASSEGHTFWANDDEERTNLTSSDYSEFLANNSVNIANSNSFDFDKLANEFAQSESSIDNVLSADPVDQVCADSAPCAESSETNLDEILANVNKDMHGGNTILSQEEIEALFAAAAAGNLS